MSKSITKQKNEIVGQVQEGIAEVQSLKRNVVKISNEVEDIPLIKAQAAKINT